MPEAGARPWDDGLQGPARRIAETDHSPLRVLAGPGTGKTFALMRRVARLLQTGANPERLLVCTFTRTAAGDLKKALEELGVDGASDVRTGTLHALCFSLLKRADVLELTGRIPRPLLQHEERFLLEDLKGDDFGGIRECEERLQAFKAAWARLQSDEPGWPTDHIDRAFHNSLLKWLKFHQAMLVGEIVPETLRYLRDNPASPDRSAFDHVVVDEYQDLNKAEQNLLDLLAERGALTVIGDEDQSIYSFKHAHPEGIATFHQTHHGTHDETLEECRRCPQRVVEIANALIANNSGRVSRSLQTMSGNPQGEVHIVQWRSMEEEARGIAQFIRERLDAGEVEAGRALVLAPRRQIGYAIRDRLNAVGIPAHSFFNEEALDGSPKEFDGSEAQQSFALLTLLADPDDRIALRCWCGFGSPSLRSGPWKRLREHCEQTAQSPKVVLGRLESGQIVIPHTGDLVHRFNDLRDRLDELTGVVGTALVDKLFPAGQPWAEPLRTLAATLEGAEFSAAKLRETLRNGITQPELPTDVDYVRVMSLHKSKGLTADLVAIMGCVEGLIPSGYTQLERERHLDEQRRLFYVALTRTRRILVLSSVTMLSRKSALDMRVPVKGGNRTNANAISSRFLSQLGSSRPNPVQGRMILRSA